jgi:hypothetical protein
MPTNLLFLLIAVIFVWLISLSIFFWRILKHYNKLTKGVSEKSLRTVLEELLRDTELNKKDIDYLKEYSARIEKDGLLHKDTGGDQSFILSLVDGKDTGVVISGLYSRSGTRWYAKRVVSGKGVDYELSEEEKKSLKEASSNP